jgi:hypothetical protein
MKVWVCKKETFTRNQRFKPNDRVRNETAPNQHFFELTSDPTSPKSAEEALNQRLYELGVQKIDDKWSFETKQGLIEKFEKQAQQTDRRKKIVDELKSANIIIAMDISDSELETKYKAFKTGLLKGEPKAPEPAPAGIPDVERQRMIQEMNDAGVKTNPMIGDEKLLSKYETFKNGGNVEG